MKLGMKAKHGGSSFAADDARKPDVKKFLRELGIDYKVVKANELGEPWERYRFHYRQLLHAKEDGSSEREQLKIIAKLQKLAAKVEACRDAKLRGLKNLTFTFNPEESSQPDGGVVGTKLGLAEGEKIEFKSSICFSPKTGMPNAGQVFCVAREIAAFANKGGGTLFLGVNDQGYVTGIESDYPVLGDAPIERTSTGNSDTEFSYKSNRDGFYQKLTNLIRFHLGVEPSTIVSGLDSIFVTDKTSGLTYAKIKVRKHRGAYPIFVGEFRAVYVRCGATTIALNGIPLADFYRLWKPTARLARG